jgi:hypothetical protein
VVPVSCEVALPAVTATATKNNRRPRVLVVAVVPVLAVEEVLVAEEVLAVSNVMAFVVVALVGLLVFVDVVDGVVIGIVVVDVFAALAVAMVLVFVVVVADAFGAAAAAVARRRRVCISSKSFMAPFLSLASAQAKIYKHWNRVRNSACGAGLPDFSWSKQPKLGKMYQIATTYS